MKCRTFSIFLFCALQWRYINAQCDLKTSVDQKDFPDITKEVVAPFSDLTGYQLSVEFTRSSNEKKKTIFVKEYRDIVNKKGRLDIIADGKSSKFYYFRETAESFDVMGDTCNARSLLYLPTSLNETMDWMYEILGPSSMFLLATEAWKSNRHNMNYMGESQIADLNAQYWRMCNGRQTVEYYFTTDDHYDTLGLNYKRIPLRVVFYNSTEYPEEFPQTYEILSFQPYVSEVISTFKIPSGIGCSRKEDLEDLPTVPDFTDGSLVAFGEASYLTGLRETDSWDFYSTFWYAYDDETHHMAYSYTPWGSKDTEQLQEGYMKIIFDTRHKYIYRLNIETEECTISRENSFYPLYELPKAGDSIALTDPMMLLPNDEFEFITEDRDRGYDVNIFELVEEDYPLTNKPVPKLIATHSYLKDNEMIDGIVQVKNRPVSKKLKFFSDANKPHTEELTLNIYEFSNKVKTRPYLFDVHKCFKNDDEYLWVVIGFPADAKTIDKIKTQTPAIKRNLLNDIIKLSELNALRFPFVETYFSDMLYVKIYLLDKPPIKLDYLEPEEDMGLVDVADSEGIAKMEDCATACLESENSCWGFALCGSVCYFGTGEAKPKENKGCKLYRRFDNDSYIPSRESAAESIKNMVEDNQIRIAVQNLEDLNLQPVFLEATFFTVFTGSDNSDDKFQKLGKKTDPRMRVVKSGYKLTGTGETIKNFGSLRYDQCQSLCLNYQKCETASYCVKDSQCILSTTFADDLTKDQMKEDNMCNLLTRRYDDHFDRSPGLVLSSKAYKTFDFTTPDQCAKACLNSKDFACLSFDLCLKEKTGGCRLHDVQYLDQESKDGAVSKASSCIHYSKKNRYHFQREDNKMAVGVGSLAATNITIEQCAKSCIEYNGTCFAYDFCADKYLTATTCTLIFVNPTKYTTTYSAVCNHYLRGPIPAQQFQNDPEANQAWVGVICFFVALVVGVLLIWGVTYFRAKGGSTNTSEL